MYDLIFGDLGCKEIVDLQTYLVEEGLTKISKLRDGHGGGDRQVTKVQDFYYYYYYYYYFLSLGCCVWLPRKFKKVGKKSNSLNSSKNLI